MIHDPAGFAIFQPGHGLLIHKNYYMISLGINKVRSSQNATKKSTATSTTRKGIKDMLILSILSPVTDDITKRQAPTGGVIKEIFNARTIIIPA